MSAHGINPLDVKVLVLPDPVEEKTAGGIILTDQHREKEGFASTRGLLVATGASAFAEWSGDKPQAGDRIVTAQYAGITVKGDDGVKYRLCNDEDVVARLTPPAEIVSIGAAA